MTLNEKEAIYRVEYMLAPKDEAPTVVYTPHKWQVENIEQLYRVKSVSMAVAVWVPA